MSFKPQSVISPLVTLLFAVAASGLWMPQAISQDPPANAGTGAPKVKARDHRGLAIGADAPKYIEDLPSGAIVDRNLASGAGYTGYQIDDMARMAKEEGVIIGARTTNVDAMRHIRDGRGVPKPLEIKSKTISELDTYLGAKPEDKGLVGYFEPKKPDKSKVPDHLWNDVEQRYAARSKEYKKLRASVDDLVKQGKVVEKEGKLFAALSEADGSLKLKPFAGDIDAVYFKDSKTGKFIPPGERYDRLKRRWMGLPDKPKPKSFFERFKRVWTGEKGSPNYWSKSGAPGQHGAETNLVSDITEGLEKGTPEYEKALKKAKELHGTLADNHWQKGEVVMEMGPDGNLRRGARFTKDTPLPDLHETGTAGKVAGAADDAAGTAKAAGTADDAAGTGTAAGAADDAADTAKAASTADDAADTAKAAGTADDAADTAKAASTADDAADTAKAAGTADDAAGTAKAAGAADDAADTAKAAGAADDAARAGDTLGDIARLGKARRVIQGALKGLETIGKAAETVELTVAAASLTDYFSAMNKALDPATPPEEVAKLAKEAAEIAAKIQNTAGLLHILNNHPKIAAAYGAYALSCFLGDWVDPATAVDWGDIPQPEGSERVCGERHKIAAGHFVDTIIGTTGEIAAYREKSCETFVENVKKGLYQPKDPFTVLDVCNFIKSGLPVDDIVEPGRERERLIAERKAVEQERKTANACKGGEPIARGPDKDGFVPVTEDPDAGSANCAPTGAAEKMRVGEGIPKKVSECDREITSLQTKLQFGNNYGLRAAKAQDGLERTDRQQTAARSLWQSEHCGLEANRGKAVCQEAQQEIDSATTYARRLEAEYAELRRSELKAMQQLAAKMDECKKASPTWLTNGIRQMEAETQRAQMEPRSEGQEVVESLFESLIELRQKAEKSSESAEPDEDKAGDKQKEEERESEERQQRQTAEACSNAASYYRTARDHYKNGDAAAYRSSLSQAKASLGDLASDACDGLVTKIVKGMRQADALERVNTAAERLLASCKTDDPHRRAGQLGNLSAQLSKKNHPHLVQLSRRLAAAQHAAEAYANTKDAFRLADFELTERSLGQARAALNAVELGDCPDVRAALAKAPKVIAQWRGVADTLTQLASKCEVTKLEQYRLRLKDMKSPVAGTLQARAGLAVADCGGAGGCPDGYTKGTKQADGKTYCIPSKATASAKCNELNTGTYVSTNIRKDGSFDCMPTKATADAWCRENNPGVGSYAVNIKPDGSHGCRPSKSSANANCRKANPGHQGVYAKINADGSYDCRQTKKAAAAAAKTAANLSCQRANNDSRARAGKYLGNGNWSCYVPGQTRAVTQQPRRPSQRSAQPPPRRSIPYPKGPVPGVRM